MQDYKVVWLFGVDYCNDFFIEFEIIDVQSEHDMVLNFDITNSSIKMNHFQGGITMKML